MSSDPSGPTPVERREGDLVGVSSAKLYLGSALGLTVLMVIATVVLTVMQPAALELTAIKRLGFFLALIIVALFAAAGINIVAVLNGHQAILMRAIGEREHAKGVVEGLKEHQNNP